MAQNLHETQSVKHFQDLLSDDLKRLSLIFFWTPWAEPCKQMSEVVEELSKRYPAVLFIKVEAEAHSEITESFDIEAVPAFLLLRGHVLLGRVPGADAAALTQLVTKHATSSAHSPLSRTDQKPAEAPLNAPSIPSGDGETSEELEKRLHSLMNQSKVVLFMKGSPNEPQCGFSRKIVSLLKDEKVDFTHFDILKDDSVRQGLKKINEWPTFPQLIIKGELVGGLDIVQEMMSNGEFAEITA